MADGSLGLVDRAKATFAAVRRRSRLVDHAVDMVQHYGNVKGGVLAGAVTYFGFLSFFPLLALGFAVVGFVSRSYPNAEHDLATAIQQIFPGIVTVNGGGNSISMAQIQDAKVVTGIVGFVGVLYSGLGWVSGLRQALQGAFQVPPSRAYNFVGGKLVDLLGLAVLGVVLIVSVGISGVVRGLTDTIIDLIGLAGSPVGAPLVWLVGILLGVAASTLLFFVMYRLLGAPELPASSLWRGALLGAVGFEALKVVVVNVLGAVGGSPFAPLAIAITLVVWINYFSRLILYGASWAMTERASAPALEVRAARRLAAEATADAGVVTSAPVGAKPVPAATGSVGDRFDPGSALLGAVTGALAALLFWRRE